MAVGGALAEAARRTTTWSTCCRSTTRLAVLKPLIALSTGQQCTAILHLLLLDNNDPLIMDQPEDNLDNAFIADRIVSTLRLARASPEF
jgi:hypothetical protein